jgi:hypothetical protein|tara:strand:- start:27 stop:266 length:240 start_codon:yes stop_codon:yes gene_type:complete
MKVLNDFLCPSGHKEEHFVDNLDTSVICRECGEKATKMRAVPRFVLPGNDPAGFPTSADKWVKKREQKMRIEAKRNPES